MESLLFWSKILYGPHVLDYTATLRKVYIETEQMFYLCSEELNYGLLIKMKEEAEHIFGK